jgi:hypothetical protein
MKIASMIVAVIHLALVVLCFQAAIFNPMRAGLAPLIVFQVDFPVSYLVMGIAHFTDAAVPERYAYTGRLIFDGILFAIIGTLWWLLVVQIAGRLFRLIYRSFRGDSKRDNGNI